MLFPGRASGQAVPDPVGSIGQSIPFACQDWANTKAAYRSCQ
ncbi:transposase DNA-binding-containing protein [Caballeronia terrestris]